MQPLGPGLEGSSHTFFRVNAEKIFTHVRLNMFPDGGISRMRVHGDVVSEWDHAGVADIVELSSVVNGATAVDWSDAHFGHAVNLIAPGRAANMGEGWETARHKDRPAVLVENPETGLVEFNQACDWAVVRLGVCGEVSRIEIDTNHFKGNFPESCEIVAVYKPEGLDDVPDDAWKVLLPRTRCQPHTQVTFTDAVQPIGPISHVKLTIWPDGGISRMRLLGTVRRDAAGAAVSIARAGPRAAKSASH